MLQEKTRLQVGVFDINGTICSGDGGLTDSVREGFSNLHNKGVKTTVITGRSLNMARKILGTDWSAAVSEDMPVSVENGGRLVNQSGENMLFKALGVDEIDYIISAAKVAEGAIRYLAFTPEETGAKSVLWLPEFGTPDEFTASNGPHAEVYRANLGQLATRMSVDGACMVRIGTTETEVMDALSGSNFFINMDELNVLAEGVDKASGVRDISGVVGVDLSAIVVAGNDFNDLPMMSLDVGERCFVGQVAQARGLPSLLTVVQNPDELGAYLGSII